MANVKLTRKGNGKEPVFRYFTLRQWERYLESIDRWEHKLMMRTIYELGCRVGELVRIRLKHADFDQASIFFPAENTKTGEERTSHIPRELTNDLKDMLKRKGAVTKRSEKIRCPDSLLFNSNDSRTPGISENRVRQIFRSYLRKSGLEREYGTDKLGRKLHTFSVHSLRHSHIMHAIHVYKIPVPIVQKQVGHKTLEATMAYCRPTDEMVAEYYRKARAETEEPRKSAKQYQGENVQE